MKKQVQSQEHNGILAARRQILGKGSSFAAQESYKTLRTNIRFFLRNKGCKRISITSAAESEGKSITILNLAISLAEDGQKVLLIDADLRRPSMARLLMEKATPGLSNVLAGLNSIEDAIHKDVRPNLDVLFSGNIPPNPSELLGCEKMQEIIKDMSKQYDYILVDTPPVGVVSDACIVTHLLDGVLLLVRQGYSNRESVKKAVANLELTGIKPLGFVLNGVELSRGSAYSYGSNE